MYHYATPPSYIHYNHGDASSEETNLSESHSYYSPRYQSTMPKSPKRHSRRASSGSYPPAYTSSAHVSSQYYTSPPGTSPSYTKSLYANSPSTLSPYVNTEKSYTYSQHTRTKDNTRLSTSGSYPMRSRNETKAPDNGANVYRLTGSPYPSVPKRSNKTTKHTVKYDIPAGYSLKNWDPNEEPILLLGSVFDANSLGKWIYDWTLSNHGLLSPMTDIAGELWLQLLRLTSTSKSVRPVIRRLSRHGNIARIFSMGSLLKVVSALPVDPGENHGSSSGRPGGLDLLGWPSPCLGIVFAAVATFFSRPHSTSRVPGAMALVFNYLSLVASGDTTATPAVLWTLRGLATYFIVFHGDITFRNYQMGQGYFSMLIAVGLVLDYCVARVLLAGQGTESSLINELFRFSLPTFSLSLCLCTYHAYYKQNSSNALLLARAEERLRIEEQLRQSDALSQTRNAQQSQSTR